MIRELLAQQTPAPPAPIDWVLPLRIIWGIVVQQPLLVLMLVIVLGVAAALPPVVKRVRRRRRGSSVLASWESASAMGEFRAAVGLLTPTEAAFLPVLVRACGADLPDGPRVMTKVRLLDIAVPMEGAVTEYADRNRVWRKHVDFVIVAGPRMIPVRVVELDDASHDRDDRRYSDSVKDEVLRRAGIPITRVPVSRAKDLNWLRRALAGETSNSLV